MRQRSVQPASIADDRPLGDVTEPTEHATPNAGQTGEIVIPDDLRKMVGRPYGRDEQGEPIAHGSGRLVVGAIHFLQHLVGLKRSSATAN